MVSHGEIWRGSCLARGVTHLAIGSSDWLGQSSDANAFGSEAAITISRKLQYEFVMISLHASYPPSLQRLEDRSVGPSWILFGTIGVSKVNDSAFAWLRCHKEKDVITVLPSGCGFNRYTEKD